MATLIIQESNGAKQTIETFAFTRKQAIAVGAKPNATGRPFR